MLTEAEQAGSTKKGGALAALDDADEDVQILALEKLVELGYFDSISLARLERWLTSDRSRGKLAACRIAVALGQKGRSLAPKVASLLGDKDPDVRRRAEAMLAQAGLLWSQASVPAVLTALRSDDPATRESAVSMLPRVLQGTPAALIALKPMAEDVSPSVRTATALALGQLRTGRATVVPILARMLADSDPRTRAAAATALGSLEGASESALKPLADRLADADAGVREAAALAIRGLGASQSVGKILALLQDPDPATREAAAVAVGKGSGHAVDYSRALLEVMEDEDWQVCAQAARALGRLGEDAAAQAPALASLLAHHHPGVRQAAREALEELGPWARDSLPTLQGLAAHSDPRVRTAVVKAIGGMRQAAGMELSFWSGLLDDESPVVRQAATFALSQRAIGEEELVLAAGLLEDAEWDVRTSAQTVLLSADEESLSAVVPTLLDLLRHGDPGVRSMACSTLGQFDGHALLYLTELANLLADRDAEVRAGAVSTLAGIGLAGVDHSGAIGDLLTDPEWKVRAAAVEAVAELRLTRFVEEVGRVLGDHEWPVRAAAARAFGDLAAGSSAQADRLIPLFYDAHEPVQSAAAAAVAALGIDNDATKNRLVEALGDKERVGVRRAALTAIAELGDEARGFMEPVANRLYDEDARVRESAASILESLRRPLPLRVSAIALSGVYQAPKLGPWLRFQAHYLGGGVEQARMLADWVGQGPAEGMMPSGIASAVVPSSPQALISTLEAAELGTHHSGYNRDLWERAAVEVRRQAKSWTSAADVNALEELEAFLRKRAVSPADSVRLTIASLQKQSSFERKILYVSMGLFFHGLVWACFLFLYPRSRTVQSLFFWSPTATRILGLVYVQALLVHVKPLRKRLMEPFEEPLLGLAPLASFQSDAYFGDGLVRIDGAEQRNGDLTQRRLTGPVLVEGDSGAGKTWLLLKFITASPDFVTYLRARDCSNGVPSAIKEHIPGDDRGEGYVETLIHKGHMLVLIDGLSECGAETRVEILKFAKRFQHAQILITTQPIGLKPPAGTRKWQLLPLGAEAIRAFLLHRGASLVEDEGLADYEEAVGAFCQEALEGGDQMLLETLSNPFDLSLVAELISQGEAPDVPQLHEQLFARAQDRYREVYPGQAFPTAQFSKLAYDMQVSGKASIPADDLAEALAELHNLVLERDGIWIFRHQRVQDFFIAMHFVENRELAGDHFGDPDFLGVFSSLAKMLPLVEAKGLRDWIFDSVHDSQASALAQGVHRIIRRREGEAG